MDKQQQLIQTFASRYQAGDSFKTILEARHLAESVLGEKVNPGSSQAKLVDEAVERSLVRTARWLLHQAESPQSAYEQLVDLHQRQPNLAVRSSTSVAQQAYSTPLPIAYLAASLARITPQKSVYEPTAGNGALLITADPAKVTVNELNAARASDLRHQGYLVTQLDAATYLPEKLHDVVIMNPPFGSVPDGAGDSKRFNTGRYSTTQIDHAIALNALKAMKPDGRAVLILGGKLGDNDATRSGRYNSQQSRSFYFTLYQQYNVVDHFSIWGDLYRKQGAGFPIDLIVIEGQGRSARSLPAADVPRIYKSYEALKELFNGPLFERAQSLGAQRGKREDAIGGAGATSAVDDSKRSGVPGIALSAGGVDDPGLAEMAGRDRGDFRLSTDPARIEPGRGIPLPVENPVSSGLERSSGTSQSSAAQQDGLVRGDGLSFAGPERADGSSASIEPDRNDHTRRVALGPELKLLNPDLPEVTVMADDAPALIEAQASEQPEPKQVPYTPKSRGKPVDTLIPVNMRSGTAKALDELEKRVGPLDEFVADRLGYGTSQELHKHLSAEQVDAVALAVFNLQRGSGFIIGDQTGVGKGRVVASMLRYAKTTGRTPIFITQNKALYADMMRDLRDINQEFKPFPTDSNLTIPLETGKALKTSATHESEMRSFMARGDLGDYDGIFTTYSQMQSIRGKETLRRDFLRQFTAKAILIMDESHEAGGTKSERQRKGETPNRAEFTRELIERAAGVFYSSATYAKRPDVMDLYAKTDMRLAVKDMSTLVSMIESGGVPMQQALATQLTEAGQYIRRERSYAGVKFNLESAPVNHRVAENISSILSGILEFDESKQEAVKRFDSSMKAEAKAILNDNSTGAAGASSTNFTAIMHNVIDQSLLAMKAEQTVQKCLSLLRQTQPEKPVIALSSTMGSFIGDYAKQNQLKPGDELSLDMGDLLKRYLERSRDVLLGDAYGEKTRHRLSDDELGPVGVLKYEQVFQQIEQTDFNAIPISPIDYIEQRLVQEGYQVDEITGRKDTIAFAPDGSATYEQRGSREVSKAAAIRNVQAFNRGDLDVLILNRSGSTGISLHASATFDDQRPRHMIVVQPEKDINQFMQTLGRIHRTGQVVLPSFTLLNADIPAEKRPAAVLAKKLASLNANTTAARSSGVSLDKVPDFMNEYSDRVVAELLVNNPALNRKLGDPLESLENPYSSNASLISRVTGRLPLLPLAEQERAYNLIEHQYTEYVTRQEAMGESILEASSLDLDARTLARMEVVPASGSDSPFTQPVYLEVIDAKTQRKPFTTLEAINSVREELGQMSVKAVDDHDFEQVSELSSTVSGATRQTLQQDTEHYRNTALARRKTEKGTEHVNRRLDEQLQHIDRLLEKFPVGERVRAVTRMGNVFYGIVGGIRHSNAEAGENPAAPSQWSMHVILADPARGFTLPLSQVNTDHDNSLRLSQQSCNWDGVDIYDVFDQRQTKNREERQVFTGNLLKAYEKFNGKLINYTDSQGHTRQGLLTPQGFDIEKSLEMQPVVIPSPRQVLTYLNEVTQRQGQVKTLDEQLTVKPQLPRQGDGFLLQSAIGRDMAIKFYINPNLLTAVGSDFYSVSDRMEAVVPKDRIEGVLKVLMEDKELPLAAFEQRAEARAFLGINLPKLEQVQLSALEAKGDHPPDVSPVAKQIPLGTEVSDEVLSADAKQTRLAAQSLAKNFEGTVFTDLSLETTPEQPSQAIPPLASPVLPSTDHNAEEVTQLGEQLYIELGGNKADLKPFPSEPVLKPDYPLRNEITQGKGIEPKGSTGTELKSEPGEIAFKHPDPIEIGEVHPPLKVVLGQSPTAQLNPGLGVNLVSSNQVAQPDRATQGPNNAPTKLAKPIELKVKQLPSIHKPLPLWQQIARALNRPVRYINRIAELSEQQDGHSLSDKAISAMHCDKEQYKSTLSSLRIWYRSARALDKPQIYLDWIQQRAEAFKQGQPLSQPVIASMQQDMSAHRKIVEVIGSWQTIANALGHSPEYCDRINQLGEACKQGVPLSKRAKFAMQQDLRTYKQREVSPTDMNPRHTKVSLQPEIVD